jgi:putative ABC transport system permease protein
MFRLSLKNVWSRKGRLVLSALAVIASGAFLSGVFVFTDTIKASFDRLFATAYEHTDAYVRSSHVIEGDFGNDTRGRIDASLVDVVAAVPGVKEANGDVSGFAAISFKGKDVGMDGPPKYGSNWSDSDASPWTLSAGHAPTSADQVVVDGASATTAKIKVGDTVTVTTRQGTREFTVSGIAQFAGSNSTGGATFVLFDDATAAEFVGGDTTKLDAIIVVGDGSKSQTELAADIQQALASPDVETLTGKQIIAENQDAMKTSLNFLTIFLSVFALISMFVGSFIIYNVFSISAAQRTQENALLRAIGASRSQVTRSMFVEALVVGIGGSLLGCVGGIGLTTTILWAFNKVGAGPGDTSLELNAPGFVITLIVGTMVTLLCAIAPAIRSGRVPPLAAMRDVAIDHSGVSRKRTVIGVFTVVAAVAAVAAGVTGPAIWLGVGVALLFLSLVVLGPLVASPIARLASPALGKLRGAPGTMAGRNAARNPKRTALTAGALAIGLALMIGVATLGSSAKASVRDLIGKSFVGDYIVRPKQQQSLVGLPPDMIDEVKATGVGDVFVIGITMVPAGDKLDKTQAVTIDPGAAGKLFTFDFVSGGFESLTPDGVLLQDTQAKSFGVGVGDTIPIGLLDGTVVQAKVEGIYTTKGWTTMLLDRAMFTGENKLQAPDFQMYIKATHGESAAVTQQLKAIMEKYPIAKVQTRNEFIASQDDAINGFLTFIYIMLAMSIFIAVVGIVITLWLSVWERRRELGLLRAVGTTRRQVRSSVLWESLITGVVGIVMGVVLGLALGWIIWKTFEDDGLSVFELPTSTVIVAAVGSLVLAAAAAVIPARKAAKSDILAAIATT